MMPVRRALAGIVPGILLAATLVGADDPPPKSAPAPATTETPATPANSLGMSKAVVCRSIDGYEDFEPLPNAEQTNEEKLQVYYRPLKFRVEKKGRFYLAHLTQDGRLRRKGEKAVLFSKVKMVEYMPKNESPFDNCYLRSLVSLKGLKPGEYEFDITLHDELVKGSSATQSVSFRVIPVATKADDEKPAKEDPAPVKVKAKGRRQGARSP